jgi:hypothetical protein
LYLRIVSERIKKPYHSMSKNNIEQMTASKKWLLDEMHPIYGKVVAMGVSRGEKYRDPVRCSELY